MDIQSHQTNIYTSTDVQLTYWTAFYTAVTLFTGNDVNPKVDVEIAVACCLIFIAYLINGTIFAQMAEIVSLLTRKSNKHA